MNPDPEEDVGITMNHDECLHAILKQSQVKDQVLYAEGDKISTYLTRCLMFKMTPLKGQSSFGLKVKGRNIGKLV